MLERRRLDERLAAAGEWRRQLDETDRWRKHLQEKGCGPEIDKPDINAPKRINPKHIEKLTLHLKTKRQNNSVSVHDAATFTAKLAKCQYLSKNRTSRPASVWDSGATHGVHSVEGLFTNKHRPVITHIRGISGATTEVTMAGTCEGLHGVLHMPNCSQPVIAVGQFLDQIGGRLEFTNKAVYLIKNKQRSLVGRRNELGLYDTCMSTQEATKLTTNKANISLSIHAQLLREKVHSLHRSLGHIGKDRMRLVIQRNYYTNLSVKDLELLLSCDACHTGKIKKARRPKKSTSRATTFGHTVRSDSTSKQPIRTFSQKRYANIAIDEATRWSFVTLLRTLKHTTGRALKPLLKTDLKGLTRIFGSDLGSEFMNTELAELLGPNQLGIKHQTACADDQSQNGLAERTIGVLFAMVRTLVADAKLPLAFWGEMLITANYLRNRLPTSANPNNASPYEMRYGKQPDLRNLRPIGVRCTVLKHSKQINGSKAKSRGLKGILVGYGEPFGLKGWRVYIPDKRKIVTAPNVLFMDNMHESIEVRPPDLLLTGDPTSLDPFHEPERSGQETQECAGNDSTKSKSKFGYWSRPIHVYSQSRLVH